MVPSCLKWTENKFVFIWVNPNDNQIDYESTGKIEKGFSIGSSTPLYKERCGFFIDNGFCVKFFIF